MRLSSDHLAKVGTPLTVSPLIWGITIVVILALLAFDYFFHIRKAHVPSLKEAAIWSSIYVGLAIVFGILVLIFGGGQIWAPSTSPATSRRRPSR